MCYLWFSLPTSPLDLGIFIIIILFWKLDLFCHQHLFSHCLWFWQYYPPESNLKHLFRSSFRLISNHNSLLFMIQSKFLTSAFRASHFLPSPFLFIWINYATDHTMSCRTVPAYSAHQSTALPKSFIFFPCCILDFGFWEKLHVLRGTNIHLCIISFKKPKHCCC